MNAAALLMALCGTLGDSSASASRLKSVRWSSASDTLRIGFSFDGGRPRRLRIANRAAQEGKPALLVDFDGMRWQKMSTPLPRWMHAASTSDSSGLGWRVDLERPSSWRANWRGDVLWVELAGRARDGSIWTDPRFLGVAGVGLVAGATALWVYRQEDATPAANPGPSTNPDDGIIPPPGFGFPR